MLRTNRMMQQRIVSFCPSEICCFFVSGMFIWLMVQRKCNNVSDYWSCDCFGWTTTYRLVLSTGTISCKPYVARIGKKIHKFIGASFILFGNPSDDCVKANLSIEGFDRAHCKLENNTALHSSWNGMTGGSFCAVFLASYIKRHTCLIPSRATDNFSRNNKPIHNHMCR